MNESESFEKARSRDNKGGVRVMLQHWRAVATVCGLTLGGTVAFYTYTIYMQKYLANTLGFSKESATLISALSLTVFAAMQPLLGALSDRLGRKPLLLFFGFGATFGTVPLLGALSHATSAWMAFGLIVTGLFVASGYTSINAIVKAELFPTRIRALGVALPYALTVSIFGGTTEYIALWCKQAGHENWFAYYVSAAAAVTLLTVLRLKTTDRITAEMAATPQPGGQATKDL
jgi:MHS family alpha-ketoglutarate permease-like MFS transporter